jgi:hypothetical protein
MKHLTVYARMGLYLMAVLFCFKPAARAANNVAPPNILWHNKTTADNRVWFMNGTTYTSEVALPATTDDLGWRMVGTGDFNQDGNADIVWENENTGQNAVWYMNGTIMYLGALIQSAGDLNWRLVGVADFNGDGKPDLLWQNLVVGQNAVWIMNGTTPVSYNLIASNGDPNWRIVATADLNGDGKPDIILRNVSTGQNAVWYMNGLTMLSGDMLHASNGADASETDQDWQIVGAADLNGDGKPDLIWRHVTLGLNVCWFLNGSLVTGSAYLSRQEFNTDWRIASQTMADSTWRLDTADYSFLRASVDPTTPKVVLTYKVPTNSGLGVTVQRRLSTETNWTTLATSVQGTNYTDSAVTFGRAYEYRVYRQDFFNSQYGNAEHICAAVNAAAVENRGKVVLLVDQTLSSQISSSVDQLTRDLVGDGWSFVRYDVPRHVDDYSSSTSFRTNANNINNVIKPLIRGAYQTDPTTKIVFLIGHVPIPYSGTFNPDGHACGPPPVGPDHQGAWVADMFYGDLDGTWTDTSANYTNCNFPEPNNVPGDGKFDQDGIASPFLMKLAIGRVDFARLPILTSSPPPGVPAKSEAALIQQYLNKDHLYRLKALSWQLTNPPSQSIVYGNFHDSRDNQIFEDAGQAAVALGSSNRLVVGDFFLQRSRSSLWGMMSGAGAGDSVNQGYPYLQHTSADLANPANEPSSVFNVLLASFMGDWNLGNNNFLRTLLATPNYGLASMWTRYALWRVDSMGLGEPIGNALTRMVNDPKNSFYDRSRDLTILGDPTLRMHVLAPPAALVSNSTAGSVQLSWQASEAGAQYYVYRGSLLTGPFSRISSAPINGTSYADNSPVGSQKIYMVRTLKSMTVGNGSYMNISQGAFVTAR